MFDSWSSVRQFNRLAPEERNIVLYAESGQDWHHFASIVERLCKSSERRLVYLTSDRDDPCFASAAAMSQQLRCFYVGSGITRTWLFQTLQCDLMILTVMDLGNLQLKRSLHPVHYLYLFHSAGSTHMVDHANSYDHYDSLLCVGPHQVDEIRRREQLANLPAKNLIPHGYERLERLVAQAARRAPRVKTEQESPVVLLAPTWGEQSILNLCGEALLDQLLSNGLRVILRPHYQSVSQSPRLIHKLRRKYKNHVGFTYIDQMGESDSLYDSDLLISDWSAIAIEYGLALEKPVLFIDVPPRIRNPDWRHWHIEPMEYAIREQLGAVLKPNQLDQVPQLINQLLTNREQQRARLSLARERYLFNFGHSVSAATSAIESLANQLAEQRQQRSAQGKLSNSSSKQATP